MNNTTLTTDISTLQIKLMYIHFKSIKINMRLRENDERRQNIKDKLSPEYLNVIGDFIYDIIDVIALFENYASFCDMFQNTNSLFPQPPKELVKQIREVKKRMYKWKNIRNKIGGHIDASVIKKFCEKYNFKGVFITNNLETDFKAILLRFMLESAINQTLSKTHFFDKELDLIKAEDMLLFVNKFNEDWSLCVSLFAPVFQYFYKIGKKEKLDNITANDIGIIKFDIPSN